MCFLVISSGLGFICGVRRYILNYCLVDCCFSNSCSIADKPKLFHRTKLFLLGAFHLILMVKVNPAMIFSPLSMRKKVSTSSLVSIAKILRSTKDRLWVWLHLCFARWASAAKGLASKLRVIVESLCSFAKVFCQFMKQNGERAFWSKLYSTKKHFRNVFGIGEKLGRV